MDRKYLRAIAIIAVVLTLLMLAYTMTAALGNRSGSSDSNPPATAQSAAQTAPQKAQAQVDPKLFPQQVAGMNLVDAVAGPEAVQSVSKLHGTDIQVQTAYVVSYQGANNQMTIWFSEAKNDKDAQALFQAMDSKMPKTQAFQNYKSVKVDGKDYKFVTGMGQEHYYWLTGKRVMWVAIGGSNSANILKQVAPLY